MIDPATDRVVSHFVLPLDTPTGVVADRRGAWVAGDLEGVAHLVKGSPVHANRILVRGQRGAVEDVLLSEGSLWASGTMVDASDRSAGTGFVARLSSSTGRVLGIAVLPEPFLSLATTNDGLWATNGWGRLYQVKAVGENGVRVDPQRLLGMRDVFAIHGSGGYLWFLVGTSRALTGLDPVTGATASYSF